MNGTRLSQIISHGIRLRPRKQKELFQKDVLQIYVQRLPGRSDHPAYNKSFGLCVSGIEQQDIIVIGAVEIMVANIRRDESIRALSASVSVIRHSRPAEQRDPRNARRALAIMPEHT